MPYHHRLEGMRPFAAATTLVLLLTTVAVAQPLYQFTEPAPLTNTRYETVDAPSTLTSNGTEFFLLWTEGTLVRIGQLVDNEAFVGVPVLTVPSGTGAPSAVWTGTQFVIAAGNKTRVLDARGQPAGPEITIANGTAARLATNGRNIVMLLNSGASVRVYVLTLNGLPTDSGVQVDETAVGDSAIAGNNGRGYVIVTTSALGVRITTLDENGRVRTQQMVPGATAEPSRPPAIAGDGDDYLAVWTSANDRVLRAVSIDQSGGIHTPFT